MIFEDKNYLIIDENEFEYELIKNKDDVYLYHFIIVKYQNNTDIDYIKIDQIKDLIKMNDKKIICKYYIKKIHFYNDSDNDNFEYGEPYYIYNVGYFYIGGFISSKQEDLLKIKKMFKTYEDAYKIGVFPFDDVEFLSLNK